MTEQEAVKVFASIESETGLKAFETYMDLRWAEFYADIGLKVMDGILVLCFMVALALGFRVLIKETNK